MSSRKITIDEWAVLAEQGCAVQVTTLLNGESMRPLIRRLKDPVTIVPVTDETRPLLQVGDVVLFTDGKRYVVHRICKIEVSEEMVQTWGDGCAAPDKPIPRRQVLGHVVRYSRDGKEHALDTQEARDWGIRWMEDPARRRRYLSGRSTMLRARSFLGRAARKMGLRK